MRLLMVCVLALVGVACQKEIHEVRAPGGNGASEAAVASADRPVSASLSVAPPRRP